MEVDGCLLFSSDCSNGSSACGLEMLPLLTNPTRNRTRGNVLAVLVQIAIEYLYQTE